ncbi:MAG: hypothetical protein KAI70_01750 [Candidatus Omnitrophica bacterium]|nr:hypothetical protein [Candidatus Omnitrophota bacterium]
MKGKDIIIAVVFVILLSMIIMLAIRLEGFNRGLEKCVEMVEDAVGRADIISREEIEDYMEEIDSRLSGVTEDIELIREEVGSIPRVSAGDAEEALGTIRQDVDGRISDVNREVNSLRDEIQSVRRDIDRIGYPG